MKKILVVDDDKVSLTMAQRALQDQYMLVLVKSGLQALTFLGNNTCNLVLLDYEMPIMSGVQVLERIRQNPATADIPVIFLTGNNDTNDIHATLAHRPNGYLLKPFDARELRKRVKEIIDQ